MCSERTLRGVYEIPGEVPIVRVTRLRLRSESIKAKGEVRKRRRLSYNCCIEAHGVVMWMIVCRSMMVLVRSDLSNPRIV